MMVPIRPTNNELEYMLNDSGSTVLVALESLYTEVAAEGVDPGRTKMRTVATTNEPDPLGQKTPPELLGGSSKQRIDQTLDRLDMVSGHRPTFTMRAITLLIALKNDPGLRIVISHR
jgi:long-chain acyl-CoA synthetase